MPDREKSILLRLEAEGRQAPRVELRPATDTPALERIELRRSGQYEILGELATGGVGEVMRGRDIDLGRDVALKMLRVGHLDNPELIQRFVEEAQIGGQLQHPGIVPVYELGLEGGRPFFAMKMVKGQTLAALVKERGDDAGARRSLLQVFEHLCQTVAYAHSRAVVHRDLKPSNVMIGAFGEVQVLDWGFAKVLRRGGIADERPSEPEIDVTKIATVRSGEGSESLAGSVMGTPAYMPPEQALGQVELLDERSDVFSLGAILCEILTGEPPYVGDELLVQAAQCLLDDAHGRLDTCDGDAEMVALTRECLEPLRKQRPRDASVLAARVQGHLAAVEERAHRAVLEAAKAKHETERARAEAQEQGRARRQSLVLATSVLLALLIGGGSYLWIQKRQRDRARRTSAAVAVALVDAQDYRGAGQWAEARTAAGRAVQLARAEGVDAATRARAERLATDVESEAERAAAAAEQESRERKFVERLEEIRMMRGGSFDDVATDRAYLTAFAERELDAEGPGVAERMRESYPGVLPDVAAALDEWSWLRRTMVKLRGSDWRVIADLAKAVDPDPWRDELRDAVASGDLEALRELSAGARENNPPLRSLVLLGLALGDAGDRQAAVEWFEALHRDHPGDFWVSYHLGLELNRCDPRRGHDAVRHFAAAVALRPLSGIPREQLATALLRVRKKQEALFHAREAVRLMPDSARTHSGLGIVLKSLGKIDDAEREFREAIRLAPDVQAHRFNLGLALTSRGDREGAIAAYREALHLDPALAMASLNLSLLLQGQGDLEGAMEVARNATARGRERYLGYVALGRLLRHRGEIEEAAAALRRSLELNPRSDATARKMASMALGSLGSILADNGDLDAAIERYREALAVDRRNGGALLRWGHALLRKGDADGAIAKYQKLDEAGVTLGRIHLGYAFSDKGELKKAAEAFRAAARGFPMGSSQRRVADMFARAEEVDPRLEAVLAGEGRPADAEEKVAFALAAEHRGRFADALRLLTEAFAEDESGSLVEQWRITAVGYALRVAAGAEDGARYRGQALRWMREDLAVLRDREKTARTAAIASLVMLKTDYHWVGVRDEISALPEPEREPWREFWADVAALLNELRRSR